MVHFPDALSSILQKVKPVEDISALLPPGYKLPSSTEANAGGKIFFMYILYIEKIVQYRQDFIKIMH